jgi:hypothetical protein
MNPGNTASLLARGATFRRAGRQVAAAVVFCACRICRVCGTEHGDLEEP